MKVGEQDGHYVIKISDFGLSRNFEESAYYALSNESRFPVKWTAPVCYFPAKIF